MSGWGVELWDGVGSVVGEVTSQAGQMGQVYTKFIKERGEVEREYARSLRKLVGKYSDKDEKKNLEEEESSQTRGFRLILLEVGYQAGQHELLSDMFMKTFPQEIKLQVKDTYKKIENHRKDIKVLQNKLDKAYRNLEKSKEKYVRHHTDWQLSKEALKNAEAEGTTSKNEMEMMNQIAATKRQQVEDYKGEYAQQLVKTNKSQSEYFNSDLPAVLDSLQILSQNNCQFVKRIFSNCVGAEKEAAFIISKCHEEIENVIEDISPEEDTDRVIEKYKTGNIPPPDMQFEDLSDGHIQLAGPGQIDTEKVQHEPSDGRDSNLYQKKRDLEKKIKDQQMLVEKGLKEVAALQLMVHTYKANPKFGDAGEFSRELDTATQRVEVLQSGVQLLGAELSGVSARLDQIRMSGSSFSTPEYGRREAVSPGESVISSVQSVSTGYVSALSNSSASDKDNGSIDEDYEKVKEEDQSDEDLEICTMVDNDCELLQIYSSGSFRWMKNVEDFPSPSPPPPPPPPPPPLSSPLQVVVALYPFEGQSASNIPMVEGEQFYVTEDDQDGWIRVRRVDGRFIPDEHLVEGFVPTAFLKFLA